jgi:hypothetical protein
VLECLFYQLKNNRNKRSGKETYNKQFFSLKKKRLMELQSCNINLTEPLASNAEWIHEKSAQVGVIYRNFS